MGTPGSFTSLLDRMADRFTVGDTCWEWTGSTTKAGYGMVWRDGKQRYAHRVLYELLVGPIPEGLEIDHLCRTRNCVNPGHLEPVTGSTNVLRGLKSTAPPTGITGWNAAKTHCLKGHEFTEANTRIDPRGHRVCRACHRLQSRERRCQS